MIPALVKLQSNWVLATDVSKAVGGVNAVVYEAVPLKNLMLDMYAFDSKFVP
jgi:hypothetical protein